MSGVVRSATLLVAALALGACTTGQAPASGPLGAQSAGTSASSPGQSVAASPSEEPDVDSPDETEAAATPLPTAPSSPLPSPAGKGVSGTWDGVWQNDPQWGNADGGFTMTLTQHGTSFEGPIDVTGPTCVRHGTSQGTLTGRHVSMGWIATGVRDIAFEGTLEGETMSGTWTAIACNLDVEISGTWSAQRE